MSLKNIKKRADLIQKAVQYNIKMNVKIVKGSTENWCGKAKGKLQISRERGLLALQKYNIEDFSDNGKKQTLGLGIWRQVWTIYSRRALIS